MQKGLGGLLELSDFRESKLPSKNFELVATSLEVGARQYKDVRLLGFYDRDTHLRFSCELETDFDSTFSDNLPEVRLRSAGLRNEIVLAISSIQIGVPVSAYEFVAVKEPVHLDIRGDAKFAEVVIINGPHVQTGPIELEVDSFRLTITNFHSSAPTGRERRQLKFDFLPTGSVCINPVDGSRMGSEVVLKLLNELLLFLAFVRGGFSSLGHVLGKNAPDELAFACLGFMRCDPYIVEQGWYGLGIGPDIRPLFSNFVATLRDNDDAPVVRQAIGYYRASNVIRETSLEMGLVASYAALETLVPHVLHRRAGWSSNLLGAQTSFHDRLRAAAHFIGLIGDPFEHLDKLRTKAAAENRIDAFQMISKMRNRVTHPKAKPTHTGVELYEAWQLSQWLVEILIFYMLRYRGRMRDRRRYRGGWTGQTTSVPLPGDHK